MDVIEMSKLEDILSAVEYNGGGITELKSKGCVKSVQRGVASISATNPGSTQTIQLSAVDPDKTLLDISSAIFTESNFSSEAIAQNLTSTGFEIKARCNSMSQKNISVAWQAVEFY